MVRLAARFLSLACCCVPWFAEVAANIVGGCCAKANDGSRDYFPDKAAVNFSTGFLVEYHETYKVVTITRSGEVYVLWQRGTAQPSHPSAVAFIPIPIERAAVLSNAYFPYFELLGERRSIVVTTKHDYLNEPCLQKMVTEDGMLDGVTNRDLSTNNVFAAKNVDVIFRWSGSRDDPLNNQATNPVLPPVVRVDTGGETVAAGMVEWMEYVSLFFNREREASRMVDEMKARYDCIVSFVQQQSRPAVRVLYSSFSYSSSSSEVRCSLSISAYTRQMITDLGGVLVDPYEGYSSSSACNMTAFREMADTADVWLYKSNNFQEGRYGSSWAVMWNISAEIADVEPYKQGRTFDPNGNHFRDFWASRMVQLDVELEDMVVMMYPDLGYSHQRVWWLDVKTQVDPGRPQASACTCKYGAQRLKKEACPGNTAVKTMGNANAESDYGCNGELAGTQVCCSQASVAAVCSGAECPVETETSGADIMHMRALRSLGMALAVLLLALAELGA